jgi:hypothetical protein
MGGGTAEQRVRRPLKSTPRSSAMKKTLRTIRSDISFLSGLCLAGFVVLAVLTGTGMDERVELFVSPDDLHALAGYGLALVAALHVLLQVGRMRSYLSRRLRSVVVASRDPRRREVGHRTMSPRRRIRATE